MVLVDKTHCLKSNGLGSKLCHVLGQSSLSKPTIARLWNWGDLWAHIPRVWERQQRNTILCRLCCNHIATSLQKRSVSPVQNFLGVCRQVKSRLAERTGHFEAVPSFPPAPASCSSHPSVCNAWVSSSALKVRACRMFRRSFQCQKLWCFADCYSRFKREVPELEPDWYCCLSVIV